jgi:hypothetical protein
LKEEEAAPFEAANKAFLYANKRLSCCDNFNLSTIPHKAGEKTK